MSPNGPITGTAPSAEAGQNVNISLGNSSYSATVQADGMWSVSIPTGALPIGLDTVTATLTDDAGNSTTVTDTFVQI
ncbi:Ig-like domain-containing protein [Amycolatopsis sp.]|uniref:Ig-like domain-containing protein n=1 Tax=Amycolatopsis sp. TaxID=37632 RepID=UPI0026323019|nr:Ig-like domain-containing protein [Amycolatopsis sp.]